ncbi:MAG: aldehyde ferredoxin oxidoreductase N-terminal domain-containing protein [Myxococcota bacterium]|nr:aldehyde ferredoxin oxidoreductase N-terminal domain-containing protein [Myxococcota bacterium]
MNEKMIRVDMTSQTASVEDFPEKWRMLGGRSLSARILLEECDPACDPLGPDNVFILAPGVLSGTAAPTSGRMSVGAKSPLTNGIKEANAGGNPAQDMVKLGYRVIVVKGKPADPEKRYAVDVSAEGISVKEVTDCKAMWNYALIEHLAQSYSASASFVSIGPAGEALLSGASVACTDADDVRRPARHAARGGLGAVMGSKGLKYFSVDAGKLGVRQAADKKGFLKLCKGLSKTYLGGPQPMKYGTSPSVDMANALYTFPYKNRVEGQSPDAPTLTGTGIVESFEERGGGMHNCMTGCIVSCSNVVHDPDGNYKTSALEFETLTLLGANCAVDTWDKVAELDRLCDEVGLDTIEVGAAIGVLMDSGGMEWGDNEAMKRLIAEIGTGTEQSDMIGNGAVATGDATGHHRVPSVKGQAIPAWDPRPLKATGVTYCTSAMGADHTAGLVVNPGTPVEDLPRFSQMQQLINMAVDASGLCMFLHSSPEEIRNFYSAYFGKEISREAFLELTWQSLVDEWEFNRLAGWKNEDDVMPKCMETDPVGPLDVVFDVPHDVIQQTYVLMIEPTDTFFLRLAAA